ncbi:MULTISPECIES: ABC transporter ATP-binding protein [unclassified Beijerinckia]|uniref:ABC transporter ATP-binding protein n=1 Tax=unclassified Beijerinckia TaxID=2638183 RepID=UPI000896CF62|nr:MULTISPECIES: ABC transporter ATP-binding protein [unclassified Beijerinckia]MDH7796945.1 NitT/TauT family transport system ATP-binding protein [Beijerinckia sp. GAS462]SEC66173.1 NitT/TauT family transport system ATP-binding protein [Beijerinckia sp. 28-YEA-48]
MPIALVVPDDAPVPSHADVLISLQDTGKTYETRSGPVVAVEAASLDLARGETLALLGPSGCGKSTLLMMVAGLLEPSSGQIVVNGRPLSGPIPELGFVFQRDLLLDWRTVLDNVLLPFALIGENPKQHESRARMLLERVGLAGFEHKRPYELSGGMRQRVAICRALIGDPDIFLLDEPFAALDAFTREQMQLDMQRLSLDKPRTTILVTHEISEAVFMADRVAVMTARPSRIHQIIDIELPRPRTMKTRETEAFARYITKIHGIFASLGVIRG